MPALHRPARANAQRDAVVGAALAERQQHFSNNAAEVNGMLGGQGTYVGPDGTQAMLPVSPQAGPMVDPNTGARYVWTSPAITGSSIPIPARPRRWRHGRPGSSASKGRARLSRRCGGDSVGR